MVVTTQLMRYFILCSLTLFLQCFAMPNTVWRQDEDDSIYYYTTGRPYWNEMNIRSTRRSFESDDDNLIGGYTVFILAMAFGIIFLVLLLMYFCRNGNCLKSTPVPSSIVHPLQRNMRNFAGSPTHDPTISFANYGYSQVGDTPPDYATVTSISLNMGPSSPFPIVTQSIETPPPKFEEYHPTFISASYPGPKNH